GAGSQEHDRPIAVRPGQIVTTRLVHLSLRTTMKEIVFGINNLATRESRLRPLAVSRHLKAKYREVLIRGGISGPVAQFAHEASDDRVKRLGGETLYCVQEPCGAKHLPVGTHDVRDAVGIDEDSVARAEHHRSLLKRVGLGSHANGKAFEIEHCGRMLGL